MSNRIEADLPISAAAAVAGDVAADATFAVSGFGSVGYPKAVPLALASSGRDLGLTITSGGALGDEIDTELAEADAIARRYPFATRHAIRERANDGRTAFRDRHVSGIGDEVRFGGLPDPDVALVEAVAVGEGWLVPSTSIGQTPAFVEAADRLVVEVNEAQPRGLEAFHDVYRPESPPRRGPIPLEGVDGRVGSPRVEFDPEKLSAVVRTDRPDATYEFREPTAADRAIGDHLESFLAAEIERNPALSGAVNLEFGVGSIGNALMGALDGIDFGDRRVAYFGEVLQDGLLDALDSGLLEGASATSLALSEGGQQRLFDDIDRYAEDVVLRPAEVSNAASLIDRFGVVAVNAAVEVDLYGHVNSTHVRGSTLLGGLGGSGDFTRHGLVSIIACPSTADGGDVSRIVPMATHVDHTEHDVDVVVTDRGVADLRGTSPRESAAALVEVAHPDFRADLRRYVDRAEAANGHIPHDLGVAFDWRQ
ncbi:MAG: acetyl-CoA hydrolase/transferase C-terminal domain-containing protein [Haloarculaceae archaeon]